MTYRTIRGLVGVGSISAAALAFLIVPYIAAVHLPDPAIVVLGAAALVALYVLRERGVAALDRLIRRRRFGKAETRIVLEFAERVGVSFTMVDLVEAIRTRLERLADMSVLIVRANTWESVYQSSSAAAADPATLVALERNFREWSEGYCYFSEEFRPSSSNALARGFLVKSKGLCFFILTRLCPVIEPEALQTLFGELKMFFDRVVTISDLFEVASRSKEWELISSTQRSFLPRSLPKPDKLDLSVTYRPLIGVSGDYYDAQLLDETRLLLVFGDVSGRGLAAALTMGIILNTVRAASDKADLEAIIRDIDSAIRETGFDDMYTAVFLGIVDTQRQVLRFVNASVSPPFLISQSAMGSRLGRLESTMGPVGLLPLGAIPIEETPIRTQDILVLASDGVTEVSDDTGVHLGETEQFKRVLGQSSRHGSAEEIVAELSGLLYSYVGDKALADDVTILAVKVGKLWA